MDGPTDLDALAEALREDGVVVDRVMGSGESREANDRIAKLVRETPFPLYVALIQQPDGLPDNAIEATDVLAGLLNRRLGDGFYVLETSDSILQVYSYGLGADPARLSLSAHSNTEALDVAMQEASGYAYQTEGYVSPPSIVKAEVLALTAPELLELGRGPSRAGAEYPVTLSDPDAERLAEHALEVQERARWSPWTPDYVEVRTASSGLSALVGGLSGLVIALLLGQSLRGWPRSGRPRPGETAQKRSAMTAAAAPPPDLEVERARASRLVDVLSKALEGTDWHAVQDRDVAGRALTARDAVEPLLTSDDAADLIGARVLAQIGAADLGRGRRGDGPAFVPCFFDPRHKPGTAIASWRLGDGEVDVPCCATCAKAVARGETPKHLRLAARRGTVAYWERDDVWARTGFGAVTDDLARDVLAARAEER